MTKKAVRAGYITIKPSTDGQFYVTYIAEGNLEPLAPSETVKSKASAKKNIRAMAKLFKGIIPKVIDYTLKVPKEIQL